MIAAVNRGDLSALLNGLVESLADVGDVGRLAQEAVRAGMALARCEATNQPVPPDVVSFLNFMAAAPTAPSSFKALRQSLNITQDQIAELAGTGRSTIAEWERGTEPMPVGVIHALMQLGAGKFTKVAIDDDTAISGAEIRELRKALKLPRWAMAEALGVSVQGLQGWEEGKALSQKVIRRIRVPYRELCARASAG